MMKNKRTKLASNNNSKNQARSFDDYRRTGGEGDGLEVEGFGLRCNLCRKRLKVDGKAVVTNCLHIFCIDCANFQDCLSNPKTSHPTCPMCNVQLTQREDLVCTSLNPSQDYKSSVLSGLNPSTIFEITGKALNFWTYQQSLESRMSKDIFKRAQEIARASEIEKLKSDAHYRKEIKGAERALSHAKSKLNKFGESSSQVNHINPNSTNENHQAFGKRQGINQSSTPDIVPFEDSSRSRRYQPFEKNHIFYPLNTRNDGEVGTQVQVLEKSFGIPIDSRSENKVRSRGSTSSFSTLDAVEDYSQVREFDAAIRSNHRPRLDSKTKYYKHRANQNDPKSVLNLNSDVTHRGLADRSRQTINGVLQDENLATRLPTSKSFHQSKVLPPGVSRSILPVPDVRYMNLDPDQRSRASGLNY
ncbi:expressed protein [Phakopsora pachyrhizi]|uniref:Expressed protein n=1 Tax=Phakopsora pachyrhizi TaxID=170000 RepID=A0AAV0BAK6_PHAPC|nr:expressed protein [Phakopsora pachyrhizi]